MFNIPSTESHMYSKQFVWFIFWCYSHNLLSYINVIIVKNEPSQSLPCGCPKNVSSRERMKLWIFVN